MFVDHRQAMLPGAGLTDSLCSSVVAPRYSSSMCQNNTALRSRWTAVKTRLCASFERFRGHQHTSRLGIDDLDRIASASAPDKPGCSGGSGW